MSYEVSILVPVYNVSNYIERCAHSLFQQTFDNIEFVFVNDCTPDDSIEKLHGIIEKYPHRKKNIKIINHSLNLGSSGARNTALANSTGKYISFIDSDDYIEPDMIQLLYDAVKANKADISACDLMIEYIDHSEYLADFIPDNKDEIFKEIITTLKTQAFMCNKLVLRSLYENPECRIPDGLNYFEDRYVITHIYYYTDKIIKVNKPLYHYVQYNTTSITKKKSKMHFDNVIQYWKLMDAFFIEKNIYDKYKHQIELSKIQNKVRLMMDVDSSALRKEYAAMFIDIEKNYTKYLRRGERIMLFLLRSGLFGAAQLLRQIIWYKNH